MRLERTVCGLKEQRTRLEYDIFRHETALDALRARLAAVQGRVSKCPQDKHLELAIAATKRDLSRSMFYHAIIETALREADDWVAGRGKYTVLDGCTQKKLEDSHQIPRIST